MDALPKTFLQIILQVFGIQASVLNRSDDLCLLFCLILLPCLRRAQPIRVFSVTTSTSASGLKKEQNARISFSRAALLKFPLTPSFIF